MKQEKKKKDQIQQDFLPEYNLIKNKSRPQSMN